MSDSAAASALMRELAPAGSAKERIGIAATTLRWSWSRAKAIWYGEARRINAGEMDALRAAVRKREVEGGKREYAELRARIAKLEAALAVVNKDMDSDTFDALLTQMRGPGRIGRTGTDGGNE